MENINTIENNIANENNAQSVARDITVQASSGFSASDFDILNANKLARIKQNDNLRLNNQRLQMLQLEAGQPMKSSFGQDTFNSATNIFANTSNFLLSGGFFSKSS